MNVLLIVLILGVTTTFWSLVGLGRYITLGVRAHPSRSRTRSRSVDRHPQDGVANADPEEASALELTAPHRPAARDVAVLVAAHNEEMVIAETIRAAGRIVDVRNIFVVSDGSSDATADIARRAGANVLELSPNRGKAGALAAAITEFNLRDRFEVVLLLDADTQLAPDYLESGLPLFDDPDVVAVAGRARTIDDKASSSRFGRFLLAYRERLYVIVQVLMKFGQAAKWANAVSIVPGFASMYRTRVLADIDITAPGLVIEDFNMTFEVHAKKLGRIEFHPWAAVAYTQDPDNLSDYIKQVRRWILGFWQTVRRHRLGFSVFWVAMVVFIIELVTSSILFVLLLPALCATLIADLIQTIDPDPSSWTYWLSTLIEPQNVLIGVLLPDYVLTIFTVCLLRRPRYLLLGLGFPLMRILDAALCLRALPRAFVGRSSGAWVSPTRRANPVSNALATGGSHTVTPTGALTVAVAEDDQARVAGVVAQDDPAQMPNVLARPATTG